MLEVYKLIAMVAPARTTVLLEGESGTGKELVARAIHRNGARAAKPFLAVNCAAIPEGLLESELFGHARGSFTGAVAEKRGLFEEASGGTLFLDEVGDTSLAIQSKILRVLQEQEVRRVGSTVPIRVDVRVIAATNRDLAALVQEGRFREDLYYRLNVVTIRLPPLRERKEDIPLLVAHLVRKHARAAGRGDPPPQVAPEALAALCAYRWPGNVRELEHVVERAVTLAGRPILLLDDLPQKVREAVEPAAAGAPAPGPDGAREGDGREPNGNARRQPSTVPVGGTETDLAAAGSTSASGRISLRATLEAAEREHIERVLRETGGDRQAAARILGIDRKTLYRKALRYGLQIGPEE
jgi:transcriptional regulator with GAF, ATPase, and Fis domain